MPRQIIRWLEQFSCFTPTRCKLTERISSIYDCADSIKKPRSIIINFNFLFVLRRLMCICNYCASFEKIISFARKVQVYPHWTINLSIKANERKTWNVTEIGAGGVSQRSHFTCKFFHSLWEFCNLFFSRCSVMEMRSSAVDKTNKLALNSFRNCMLPLFAFVSS